MDKESGYDSFHVDPFLQYYRNRSVLGNKKAPKSGSLPNANFLLVAGPGIEPGTS